MAIEELHEKHKEHQAEYNEIYARPDEAMSAEEVERSLDGPWHTTLRKNLEDINGKKIIEVACGQGALCYWLNSQGAEVWSGDYSQEAVDQTSRLVGRDFQGAGERVKLVDLHNLPYDDNTFDCFVSCETLEHLPEFKKGIHEYFRVLKPGGRLYLTTENYLNFTGLYRLLEEKVRGKQWNSGSFIQPVEQFFTAPQVLSDLKKEGFKIEKFDTTGNYFFIPKQPYPFDMKFLNAPGPHRLLMKYLGRHLFVKAVKPD